MHFVTCLEMEAAVLHRVGLGLVLGLGFLAYSCPKQGQDFQPSAAPLYPNMGQVPLQGGLEKRREGEVFNSCTAGNT